MKKLDVILRTCSNSLLQNTSTLKRICGDDREQMIFKCLSSLIVAINNSSFPITLTVLDDHSNERFLKKLDILLERCNKSTCLISLEKRGYNNSAYEQFLLASRCEDLVYSVEDDYLHEPNAIENLLTAFRYLSDRYQTVALFPYDDPLRYEQYKEEPTLLLFDGNRYWRQVTKTTNTIFSSSKFFRDNFQLFKKLALDYPNVMEDDTINTIYKNFLTTTGSCWTFNPIPSIAYHMSTANPARINTCHLKWETLWNSLIAIDLIDGWFNYKNFYANVLPYLNDESVIVEVGSWLGKSSIGMHLMNKSMNKNMKIYCVDTWEGSNEQYHFDKKNELKNNNLTLHDKFMQTVTLFDADEHIIPIKNSSVEASKLFEAASIDLLIIDASHEYQDVLVDIKTWLPKVKKGGIIAGDDYSESWPGVKAAVNDFFGKNNFDLYESTWFKRM